MFFNNNKPILTFSSFVLFIFFLNGLQWEEEKHLWGEISAYNNAACLWITWWRQTAGVIHCKAVPIDDTTSESESKKPSSNEEETFHGE